MSETLPIFMGKLFAGHLSYAMRPMRAVLLRSKPAISGIPSLDRLRLGLIRLQFCQPAYGQSSKL